MKWTRITAAVAMLSFAASVFAQAPAAPAGGEGISVSGVAEAKGKPTLVEIGTTVAGDSELAADAIVKYRDARRRAVEALQGLKIEGMRIEPGGFAVNQGIDNGPVNQAAMQGGTPPMAKSRVIVGEQLKLVLTNLDKQKDDEVMETVLRVLDAARDAGLQVGPPLPKQNYNPRMMFYGTNEPSASPANLLTFKLPDADALREQAYKAAMADARKKAERLATLAGVSLGKVISVKGGTSDNELTSNVYKEIPVKVNLTVQFEIVK